MTWLNCAGEGVAGSSSWLAAEISTGQASMPVALSNAANSVCLSLQSPYSLERTSSAGCG